MYILLLGKSMEGEQCVTKDTQANQDVECQWQFHTNHNMNECLMYYILCNEGMVKIII
jgi:hypothetical protein